MRELEKQDAKEDNVETDTTIKKATGFILLSILNVSATDSLARWFLLTVHPGNRSQLTLTSHLIECILLSY